MRRVIDESKPSRSFKYRKMVKYFQEIEFSVPVCACHCVTQGVTAQQPTIARKLRKDCTNDLLTTYEYDEAGVIAAYRKFIEIFKDGYKKLSKQDKKDRGCSQV